LSEDVRAAFKAQLADAKRVADQQVENFHVQVYLMNRSGLTFDEIAEIFGTRSSTVTDWKRKGEEAYKRRESARDRQLGEDPVRPGEREPVG
jgi:DNA-directed RNA polymerase specialized sigma24 family protein